MRYWRLATRLTTALVTTAVLAGCIAGTDDAATEQQSGQVTVEFWTINLKKDFGDYIQGLVDRFEADHSDISIRWVDVPGEDIESKFLAAIASKDVPDAVNIEDYRVDQFGDSLADLTPYLDDKELASYQGAMVDSLRRGDQLKAIPWYNGGAPVAAYDSAALAESGIRTLPSTWEEAFNAGRTIAQKTGKCAFNALPTIGVLMSYDVPLLNEDRTEAVLNNPQAVEVLEKFKAAYDDGTICPGAVTEQTRNLPQSLENGLAAAAVSDLPFLLLNVETNAPEVYGRLQVDRAVTGSSGKFVIPGMQSFVVPEKSDVQEQAAEFIKWVTSPENQLALCKLTTVFPSTQDTLKDPFFTDIEPTTPADAARKVVVSEQQNVVPADIGTDTELDKAYLERIRGFMTGDAPAAETLAAVSEDWDELLAGAK
ncbi:extracellular solute-binding protein [Actinophytocola sp.]|uniref:ABC transporter substrate-binding protein n=1 Tax=Actinophytocola sp. TaxID=1872138 RepID=UPI003D6C4EAF